MGAVIGRAPKAAVRSLRSFGRDVGMAFQIIDDVLDLREGTQVLGKPAGNDLRQGVVTLPTMIYAAEHASDSDTIGLLESIISGDETRDDVIDGVIREIRASGALEASECRAGEFTRHAEQELEAVPVRETRDFLFDILDMTIVRST